MQLYAHLAVILTPLPNPLLADLVQTTYPVLVQLHDRMKASLPDPPRIDPPPRTDTWWDTLTFQSSAAKPKTKPKTSSEKKFERGRWAWFAAAGLGMVTYLFASGIVEIDWGGQDVDDEEGEWLDASELEDEEDEEPVVEYVEETE